MAREPLSLRAYAQHRKSLGLKGATLKSVQKALDSERISFVIMAGQRRIADPEAADREWADNTRLADDPDDQGDDQEGGEGGGPATRERHWKANMAELNFRQKAGELVSKAEVIAATAEKFSTVRTKVLGISSRTKQRLPHLTFADLAVLDELLREALEELATQPPPAAETCEP